MQGTERWTPIPGIATDICSIKKDVKRKRSPASGKPRKVSASSPSAAVQAPRGVVARARSGREEARCRDAVVIVSTPSFPSYQEGLVQNGPELSRARRFGAAPRTLDGEDRSATICQEGKEGHRLCPISLKRNKRNGCESVATTVLSETRGL